MSDPLDVLLRRHASLLSQRAMACYCSRDAEVLKDSSVLIEAFADLVALGEKDWPEDKETRECERLEDRIRSLLEGVK